MSGRLQAAPKRDEKHPLANDRPTEGAWCAYKADRSELPVASVD